MLKVMLKLQLTDLGLQGYLPVTGRKKGERRKEQTIGLYMLFATGGELQEV